MNRQSPHLRFHDLVALLRRDPTSSGAADPHLSECAECRGMLKTLGELDGIRNLHVAAGPYQSQGSCLSLEQIALLAAGTAEADASGWFEHILACASCGNEFLGAVDAIHGDIRPEEAKLLEQVPVPSAGPLGPSMSPAGPRPAINWRAFGALAAALLIAVGTLTAWYIHRTRNAPERLLAQAYTRQRLIDYRLPDDGYAPVSRTRGQEALPPSELTRAQAELAARLERESRDARLLRLRGLAELQSLRADVAVAALQQARVLRPKDAEILCDLGTAFAERGELEERQEDFARALEFLGQALLADPGLARALFNRALVLERLNLLEDAITAWQQYLARDATTPWAREARERQAAIRAKQKGHAGKREMLLQGPDVLLRPESAAISPDLFLDSAVFRWLASRPAPSALKSIDALARTLVDRHGDVWLRESLREVPAGRPLWSQLRAAVEANINGETEALKLASDARDAAVAAGARVFAKRAEFEAIYALDRTQRARACAEEASHYLGHEDSRDLPWLGAAVRTEKAICLVMLGQEGKAVVLLNEAAELAAATGLKGQWMRARGVRIGVNTNAGDPWFTFAEAPQFLADYWSDGFSPGRVPGLRGTGLLLLAGAAVRRPGLTLPRLPELEQEAGYVADGQPVRTLAGPALTVERLGEFAATASWFHFAGHGYSNAGNGALFPAGSAGQPLTASQIARMNWTHCELAVLSACWASAGESVGFVNPESLVQAFLTAGARGVVAPGWAIHSGATAVWMREFYSAMRRGMDAPRAIREASRRLSRQSRFELPYYWASFAYFT